MAAVFLREQAPDPWAAHFSPEGPYLTIKDADRGPWIYRDKTLAIEITIPQKGIDATHYYRADIYTRGPLPCCGFAGDNVKGTSLELPYKLAREQKAVLAINGQYVRASYNPKGVILYGGNVFWDSNQAPTMAFLPSGEMKVYEPGEIQAQGLLALGVKDAFSFGPILVKDGKIHPSVQRSRLNYHSWRTAIGQVEPGHFIIIVTKNGITLTELAQLFIQCGCNTAYNLDGGHSSALVFMGNQLNKSGGKQAMQRSVPDMLMIGFNGTVPGVKDPVYANGFSLNRKYRPQPTDGLIQTGGN
jgi:hypothetical protein